MDKQFVDKIISQFRLNPDGIHGVSHWSRVRSNGLRLAKLNGADPVVIEYFALLHDSQRLNDSNDPEHGMRAAEFVDTLELAISDKQIDQLKQAC